ncbi:hypothetical protein PoB_001095400 [Plakobranchus ocellatus]|uniref:Uncharacterized protein n=1 Tax=Plakobranchus ocellatus TaxID=259542 RepID=A0AAV3YN59_9GAST|nr:hypothetical protein PoB_001095400 [Plakobranchus ocellatus]
MRNRICQQTDRLTHSLNMRNRICRQTDRQTDHEKQNMPTDRQRDSYVLFRLTIDLRASASIISLSNKKWTPTYRKETPHQLQCFSKDNGVGLSYNYVQSPIAKMMRSLKKIPPKPDRASTIIHLHPPTPSSPLPFFPHPSFNTYYTCPRHRPHPEQLSTYIKTKRASER